MKINSLIVALIGLYIISEVSATANIFGIQNVQNVQSEGFDMCSDSNRNGKIVPRPYPIPVPRSPIAPRINTICRQEIVQGPKPFNPIGDVCSCGKLIVKPAPLPNNRQSNQPSPRQLNPPQPSCSCAACNNQDNSPASPDCGNPVKAPPQYQIYDNEGATIYLEPPKRKSAASPKQRYGNADVVSVAIAQQLANNARNSVSEKELQYGSLKKPIVPEKNTKTLAQIINEESFYETKGDVLEIKPNLFQRKIVSSESESSSGDEERRSKKRVQSFNPAQLRYDDIGFAAYRPSNRARYVVVQNSQPAENESPQRGAQPRSNFRSEPSCNCYNDLVVEQSGISEQSVSYENNSDQQMLPGGRLRK